MVLIYNQSKMDLNIDWKADMGRFVQEPISPLRAHYPCAAVVFNVSVNGLEFCGPWSLAILSPVTVSICCERQPDHHSPRF